MGIPCFQHHPLGERTEQMRGYRLPAALGGGEMAPDNTLGDFVHLHRILRFPVLRHPLAMSANSLDMGPICCRKVLGDTS